MAGIRFTCPVCLLPVLLEHAVTSVAGPDGSITAVVDARAIAMHTCIREDQ